MTERYQTRRIIKIAITSFLVLFVIGYSFYEIQKVAFGPRIKITSPVNGETVSTSSIEISGTTKNIKEISLNDRKIFIDEKGNFMENMVLFEGYNSFSVKASDKFGRKTEKILEVMYIKDMI